MFRYAAVAVLAFASSLTACSSDLTGPSADLISTPAAATPTLATGSSKTSDIRATVGTQEFGGQLAYSVSNVDGSIIVFYNGSTFSKTTYHGYSGLWGQVSGHLTDVLKYDDRCSRVYARARNGMGSWTVWSLRAKVCSGGSTDWASEKYMTYRDRLQVKICAGTETSGNYCTTSAYIDP